MKINTGRSKELDAFLSTAVRVPDEKLKLFYQGQRQAHDVYRVPISLLIYNIGNGRFAAELLAKEASLKRKLDPTTDTDRAIIENLLLTQNEDETEALEEDLKKNGQENAGVITFDGAVINANRRMAIFSRLYKQTQNPEYQHLKVARLPANVDEKDLWRIEAEMQFAKDFRLDYGPINELLKLREGVQSGLSIKEISRTLLGRYNEKKLEERLATLRLIEDYLVHTNSPQQFHLVQDSRSVEKFNSLQGYVLAPLLKKRIVPKVEVAKLTTIGFDLIHAGTVTHWDIRSLAKIANDSAAKKELFKNDGKADGKGFKKEAALVEAFRTAKEIVNVNDEKSKPERLLRRALESLRGVSSAASAESKALLKTIQDELSRLTKR
jgi:hypothetical protein